MNKSVHCATHACYLELGGGTPSDSPPALVAALTVAIQLDLYHELLDSASDKSAELQRSWETYGVLPFLLPAPVVYLLATGAKGGGLAEANMRADDAIWIEKMRAKRAGKAVDD